MTTFVIVHGGWGGGWEWGAVARSLRTGGHEVHTPTLTGLGDRAHLASPDIGLATHVQDVVAVLEAWNLRDVVLVGQSYGGMVVTGVVDRVPDRLRRLVYVDAFVPFDGQSCNELCGDVWTVRMRQLADEQGDGWQVPLPFTGTMGLSDEVAAWYLPRLVPHPLATLEDRLEVTGDGDRVPRSYLHLVDAVEAADQGPTAASAAHAREQGWDYSLVVGPHDLHVEDPARMVDLLQSLAKD